MRTIKKAIKLPHNAKLTIIKCLHCNHDRKVRRHEAVFCSTLCRVQERNVRLANGYNQKPFIGNTLEFKNKFMSTVLVSSPCQFIWFAGSREKEKYGPLENWKFTGGNFIIYYSARSKKKNWTIYMSKDLTDKLTSFEKSKAALEIKPIKYTRVNKTA